MAEGDLPHRFQLAGDRPQGHDRPHPLRHLHRGDALLPERHLFPCRHRRTAPQVLRGVATDGHRLARVEVPLPKGAAEHAGRDRAAQDRGRGPQAARRERRLGRHRAVRHPHPLRLGRRHPGQQADRRHLPRLRARHPDRQRQGPGRAVQGVRPRRRPRLDHLDREVARHQARGRQGRGHALGHQPRRRQRHRGDRGRVQGRRRSRSASTRATCSTSPSRSRAARRAS